MLCAACGGHGRHTGDIESVREAGVLRVAVRPGFFDVAETGRVDERELLHRLAARLEVDLQWIETARHDGVARLVHQGRADVAVNRWSPAAAREAGLLPTALIDWVQDEVVVGGTSNLEGFGSLHGAELHLHRSGLTPRIKSFLETEGLTFREVPEEVSCAASSPGATA
jgi:hypothetical protein